MSIDRRWADDSGASAVEYGLIVFAIAAMVVASAFALGGATKALFSDSCDTIHSKVQTDASC